MEDIYCIDASSLIKLKQDFPRDVFPTVWERMEELIESGRLIAPDEVAREVGNDDVLGSWVKRHRTMFKRMDQQQINLAQDVIGHFAQLAKHGKFGPAADPFVVALARSENQKTTAPLLPKPQCIVVTEERGAQKIPGACSHYRITCFGLVELFQREAWVFR